MTLSSARCISGGQCTPPVLTSLFVRNGFLCLWAHIRVRVGSIEFFSGAQCALPRTVADCSPASGHRLPHCSGLREQVLLASVGLLHASTNNVGVGLGFAPLVCWAAMSSLFRGEAPPGFNEWVVRYYSFRPAIFENRVQPRRVSGLGTVPFRCHLGSPSCLLGDRSTVLPPRSRCFGHPIEFSFAGLCPRSSVPKVSVVDAFDTSCCRSLKQWPNGLPQLWKCRNQRRRRGDDNDAGQFTWLATFVVCRLTILHCLDTSTLRAFCRHPLLRPAEPSPWTSVFMQLHPRRRQFWSRPCGVCLSNLVCFFRSAWEASFHPLPCARVFFCIQDILIKTPLQCVRIGGPCPFIVEFRCHSLYGSLYGFLYAPLVHQPFSLSVFGTSHAKLRRVNSAFEYQSRVSTVLRTSTNCGSPSISGCIYMEGMLQTQLLSRLWCACMSGGVQSALGICLVHERLDVVSSLIEVRGMQH